MSASDVKAAIKTRIIAEFTEANSRVFTLPSKVSYLLMGSYPTPAVAIVYQGGPRISLKGTTTKLKTYNFDVFIFQTIWKEGEVTLGGSGKTGLMQLNESLIGDLEDFIFTTELPTNNIISATITDEHGTEDFIDIGGRGYSASIGFRITYKEEE